MKILYRYISFEVLKTSFLIFSLFLFVILIDRASTIAETVLGQGVSIFEFFSVLLKGIPAFFGITIPMAFVLAVILTFSNMSSNNELVALKSCGVSPRSVSAPVIALGAAFSVVSFIFLMFLAPKSNIAMKKELLELLKKKITMSVSQKNFTSNFPGITFYTEKIFPEKGYLEDFMLSIKKKNQLITIFAEKGILRTQGDKVFLDIQNGSGEFLNWEKPEEFRFVNFKNYTVKLYQFTEKEKFQASKYKTLWQLLKSRNREEKIELVKRLGLSFAPLIVGLLAFSLGWVLPRGAVGTGVLLSLGMIVLYYVLYTLSKKLAMKTGNFLLPLVPDFVFGLAAVYLYRRVIEERIKFSVGGRW